MKTYNELTNAQLVSLYNDRANADVARFSSKDAGIRRLRLLDTELCAATGQEPLDLEDANVRSFLGLEARKPLFGSLFDDAPRKEIANPVANFNGVDKAFAKDEAKLSRSEAIARSWNNPETAAKRSERNGVEVDGEEFRSVRAAFVALGLPLEKHIRFRMELKAAGSLEAFGHKFIIL